MTERAESRTETPDLGGMTDACPCGAPGCRRGSPTCARARRRVRAPGGGSRNAPARATSPVRRGRRRRRSHRDRRSRSSISVADASDGAVRRGRRAGAPRAPVRAPAPATGDARGPTRGTPRSRGASRRPARRSTRNSPGAALSPGSVPPTTRHRDTQRARRVAPGSHLWMRSTGGRCSWLISSLPACCTAVRPSRRTACSRLPGFGTRKLAL